MVKGFGAVLRAGHTTQDALERVIDLFPQCDRYVYYTDQGEISAFDANGNLRDTLCLYWHGDIDVLVAAIRAHGLRCDEPPGDRAISVFANPNAVSQTLHDSCCAAGRAYGRASGRPASRDTIYDNLEDEAARFREWLCQTDPSLFALTEQDLELCPHDNVYERYVGFGLPDLRAADGAE